MMETMKAVAVDSTGKLIDVEVRKPSPVGRDLLVRVHAVAANPVDTIQRGEEGEGMEPRIIGWDVAGTVEAVGPECTWFQPGDEVYYAGDITRPGGNCEYHLVDECIVGRKPKTLDFAQAAALPLTSITAFEGLFDRLLFQREGNSGEVVLIIGAAGGVGSIATQLARHAGLTVIGTASRPQSHQWTIEHGAHFVIDHTRDFAPQLHSIGLTQVDAVFCLNQVAPHWDNMLSVLKPQGRLCTILPPLEPLKFWTMADKSITWTIEAMFTRSKYQTKDREEQHVLLTQLAELIDAGKIRTTMAEVLTPIGAASLQEAFEKLGTHRMIGKIVLTGRFTGT